LAACSSGDADEVKAHLKIGVNINTTNIDGLTALHQACIDANLDMVSFLVDNNADINSQVTKLLNFYPFKAFLVLLVLGFCLCFCCLFFFVKSSK